MEKKIIAQSELETQKLINFATVKKKLKLCLSLIN